MRVVSISLCCKKESRRNDVNALCAPCLAPRLRLPRQRNEGDIVHDVQGGDDHELVGFFRQNALQPVGHFIVATRRVI